MIWNYSKKKEHNTAFFYLSKIEKMNLRSESESMAKKTTSNINNKQQFLFKDKTFRKSLFSSNSKIEIRIRNWFKV